MIPSRWNAKKLLLLGIAGALLLAAFSFLFSDGPSGGRRLVMDSLTSIARGLVPTGQEKEERDIAVFLRSEAARVGQVDENPERTKEQLRDLAASLSPQDITILTEKALDPGVDGDERFLAAYLIAEKRNGDPYAALKRMAMAPIAHGLGERVRDMEMQVRAQAIEGLGRLRNDTRAERALKEVAVRSEEAFLRDRAQRSLHEWRTGKPVEEQDREALEKLLEI